MPKGFFEIPNIKGDMAQKPLTMYGAHDPDNKFQIFEIHQKNALNEAIVEKSPCI